MKPLETVKLTVTYSPTNIEIIEYSELKIETTEIGDWKFFL